MPGEIRHSPWSQWLRRAVAGGFAWALVTALFEGSPFVQPSAGYWSRVFDVLPLGLWYGVILSSLYQFLKALRMHRRQQRFNAKQCQWCDYDLRGNPDARCPECGMAARAPTGETHCPNCDAIMPSWRRPRSIREAMLAGWTCHQCGCAMDRQGKRIAD